MSRKGRPVHNKVVCKAYNQNQLILPIDIESLIPANHMVRVINSAIDQMKLEPLFAKYRGGGRSSFHPVMMTKLIVYAYADKIYSSRRIEKAARENIMYMWLELKSKPTQTNTAGGNYVKYNTFHNEASRKWKNIVSLII